MSSVWHWDMPVRCLKQWQSNSISDFIKYSTSVSKEIYMPVWLKKVTFRTRHSYISLNIALLNSSKRCRTGVYEKHIFMCPINNNMQDISSNARHIKYIKVRLIVTQLCTAFRFWREIHAPNANKINIISHGNVP